MVTDTLGRRPRVRVDAGRGRHRHGWSLLADRNGPGGSTVVGRTESGEIFRWYLGWPQVDLLTGKGRRNPGMGRMDINGSGAIAGHLYLRNKYNYPSRYTEQDGWRTLPGSFPGVSVGIK